MAKWDGGGGGADMDIWKRPPGNKNPGNKSNLQSHGHLASLLVK